MERTATSPEEWGPPPTDEPPPSEGQYDRVPPHNVKAEQIVLGAMMMSVEAIVDIERIVKPGDFYRPLHGRIFETITKLAAQREPTDPIAIAEALGPDLSLVGGAPYLHTCYAAVPTAANGPWYARIVKEKADLRRIADVATFIRQRVFELGDLPAADLAEQVRERLNAIEDGTVEGARRWAQIIPDVVKAMEAAADPEQDDAPRIPTGFRDLDRLLGGGWKGGQLIVVAARTGVGKSIATLGFAKTAAVDCEIPSAIVSLEMDDVEIGLRLLSSGSKVPHKVILTGLLDEQDASWVEWFKRISKDAPLWVDGTSCQSLADIRSLARKLHRQHGLRLLVVDYLQLVETTKGAENRQQAVAAISRGLKLLAKELDIAVIAVSQLNRGPEQRADKRPILSDLRESGAIENDADVIILLHRDDYYDKESPRAGEADLIVAKQRGGSTDTVTVAAQLHLSLFADMAIV
ncbi:replicative DNA helicase [Micromonospora costi]|uniref:DNA 5'-3' helicase n=2 Tax=Micromonospora costi TaxID=1530042 RepID=A0A3B0A771_9ACTN|nr:replicative DNA helicase [Micromonospora costi]